MRLLGGDLGQEAEAAEVDAEDRSFALAHQPRDTEQRAVAAEHHDQVRAQCQLLALDRLGAELGSDLGFGERGQMAPVQPGSEFMRDRDRSRALAPQDHSNGLQGAPGFRARAIHDCARASRGVAVARSSRARDRASNTMTDLRGEDEVTFKRVEPPSPEVAGLKVAVLKVANRPCAFGDPAQG